MVKDGALLQTFEDSLLAGEAPDIKQNFRLANELYYQARKLKIFPLSNPLDGIEVDINLARVINSVRKIT
jgi:hypothetical protein